MLNAFFPSLLRSSRNRTPDGTNPLPLALRRNLLLLVFAPLAILPAGCGSGRMATGGPLPIAKTNVVVTFTSTANDQLVIFYLGINGISLADKSGNTVPLYINPSPQGFTNGNAEFIHLNGISEPIATVSVPDGVYTSAIVAVGGCSFTNVTVVSNGGVSITTDSDGLCTQGTGMTTVNLPSPITISGQTMALSFNLQVSQSYTLLPAGSPAPGYSFSPTFTLTPLALSPQPTTELNGKFTGIGALISSINTTSNSFVAQTPDGFSFTVNSGSATTYQGVAAFSTLAVGTLVNMDLSIQPDASLLASRIEVDDLSAPTVSDGPFLELTAQPGSFLTLPNQTEGCSTIGTPFCGSVFQYDSNTVFGISSQFTNLQNLPFTPSFTGPGLLLGQNIAAFSTGTFNSVNLETVTATVLVPQVVNGTVSSISTSGNFTVYTVALAPYNIFPTLQQVIGPNNRLSNPNVIQIYVDSSAQSLNSAPIAVGSLLRFRGLIFDDNGVLHMDCNIIRDGVPE